MRSFLGRDILSLKDFSRDEFFRVFQVADDLRPFARDRRNTDLLKDKTLLTAFYQPSTRTRLSTEAAMHRLGGHVLGFSDSKMTRAGDFYQESIKDTFHMLEYYADVIAIRHFQQGAPAEAAKWASVPVINCGDGWGEHPTQVLTDLYTTLREKGTLDGLTYLLVGDMRMRTMHSILYALSQFDAEAIVVGPPDMTSLPEFKAEIDALNVDYQEAGDVRDVIGEADVIYMEPVVQADYTQSRVERGRRDRAHAARVRVTRELLRDEGQALLDHPPLAAADGRAARRTSTRPATSATGPRRSTASPSRWRCSRSSSARRSRGPPMQTDLRGRDLISLQEWTKEEIDTVLEVAAQLKRERALGIPHPLLRDRVLAMLFFFSSPGRGPRSRPAWPSWAATPSSSRAGRPRSPTATRPRRSARSSGRYNDGIAIRNVDWGVGNAYIRDVAAASRVPVLNMQCDLFHPHQSSPTC